METPPRALNTSDVPAVRRRESFLKRHWGKLTLAALVLIPLAAFAAWSAVTLAYTYSSGERQGYVQKISRKGWLCKTWEGELAMSNVPGAAPQLFMFTVRNDSVAALIDETVGKRVALHYEQHIGVPSACFGDTEYFVTGLRVVE
jgi:hypothetical protein